MKKINIDSFCDYCLQQKDTYVPAIETFTVASAPVTKTIPLHTLDVCEAHARDLYQLSDVIRILGVPLEPDQVKHSQPSRDRPTSPCPLCGVEKESSGMTSHLVHEHKAKLVTQPKKCPDCTVKLESKAGMITHRRRAHGYSVHADMVSRLKSR